MHYKFLFQKIIISCTTRLQRFFGIKNEIIRKKESISSKINNYFNGVIAYGPLKGYKLGNEYWWGSADRGSIILGLYECEVIQEIFKIYRKYNINYFIDIGAADGLYGLSLPYKKLVKHSFCFEISNKGREIIKKNSMLNNVEKKVTIKGELDDLLSKVLSKDILENSLILIDIEGNEFDLLNEEFIYDMRNSHAIIELHDHLIINGKLKLRNLVKKLKKYFAVKLIVSNVRDISNIPDELVFDDNERWLLCSEGRKAKGHWLVLKPKVLSL